MKAIAGYSAATVCALAMLVIAAPAEAKKCKKDAVQVGNACVNKHEASFDMVGNADEWVADWIDFTPTIPVPGGEGLHGL